MKIIVGTILLLSVSCRLYAQSASPKVLLPQVDSMVMEMDKLFINPKNVKRFDVLKYPATEILKLHRRANLIMTFKKAPQLVSLNSMKVDSLERKSTNTLYVIDGVAIYDTAKVKIDLLNVNYFTGLYNDGTVFHNTGVVYVITTKSKGKKIARPR